MKAKDLLKGYIISLLLVCTFAIAQNPSSGSDGSGKLEITKIESHLQIQTFGVEGFFYQLEHSKDLRSWETFGEKMEGRNRQLRFRLIMDAKANFYRYHVYPKVVEEKIQMETLGIDMIQLSSGSFMMGSTRGELNTDYDERPSIETQISKDFWLSRTEITQRQWKLVMSTNPSQTKGDDLPVTNVSWAEASEFCHKLNGNLEPQPPNGYAYQLPTSAQWEYACRAGESRAYYWGHDHPAQAYLVIPQYAWNGVSPSWNGLPPKEVGSLKPNDWGLYDMSGNVEEWCYDFYDDLPITANSLVDPTGPREGHYRVVRSGIGFSDNRSAWRGGRQPTEKSNVVGFRLALSPLVHQEQAPLPIAGFEINGPNIEMLPVRKGLFAMGSAEEERDRKKNEGPQTLVRITDDYWLSKTEITQAQYGFFMGGYPVSNQKNSGYHLPVDNISWENALVFCSKLNNYTMDQRPEGYDYTLPTEAQWEYACRAGTTSRFHFGDGTSLNEILQYANVRFRKDEGSFNNFKTIEVASKLPNQWGFYDMHGNVAEFCLDFYGPYTVSDYEFKVFDRSRPHLFTDYPGGVIYDPRGPETPILFGSAKVVKGGDTNMFSDSVRSANRTNSPPPFYTGFRVALSKPGIEYFKGNSYYPPVGREFVDN